MGKYVYKEAGSQSPTTKAAFAKENRVYVEHPVFYSKEITKAFRGILPRRDAVRIKGSMKKEKR